MHKMKKVLFVDIQNSILSPMAEAWFNRYSGGCRVASSCGTQPATWLDGRAAQAMHQVGIDIGSKRPERIGYQQLAQADVVVLMGVGLEIFEWVDVRSWKIAEPPDPSFEDVCILRDRVRESVEALIGEIKRQNTEPHLTDTLWKLAIESSLSAQFMHQRSVAHGESDHDRLSTSHI